MTTQGWLITCGVVSLPCDDEGLDKRVALVFDGIGQMGIKTLMVE